MYHPMKSNVPLEINLDASSMSFTMQKVRTERVDIKMPILFISIKILLSFYYINGNPVYFSFNLEAGGGLSGFFFLSSS
jgi:hypothetical protein